MAKFAALHISPVTTPNDALPGNNDESVKDPAQDTFFGQLDITQIQR